MPFKNVGSLGPIFLTGQPAADWLRQLREAYADDVPARDLLQHTSPEQLLAFG